MDYSINGYQNEFEFVKSLNRKKINELNPMFKELIDYLFPGYAEDEEITAWKNKYLQKTDVFIKVNGKIKGISIKKGSRNSLHAGMIGQFIDFLTENNVSKEAIVEYLKYHYADGTTNGKGRVRLSAEEYKQVKQNEIDKLNKELNKKELVEKAIYQFVIKGTNYDYVIDALVYGTADDFVWIGINDIKKIIMSKRENYSTAPHIGPLVCQPVQRCLNRNNKNEKYRHQYQIKWYSLYDDIIEYLNNKQMKV